MKKKEGIKLLNVMIRKRQLYPLFIGVAGGSCSGKSYISKKIHGKVLHMDDYFVENAPKNHNFDLPSRVRFALLIQHLRLLQRHQAIKKPAYDFVHHHVDHEETFTPGKVIIVEGIHALHKRLLKFYDIRIFVDAPLEKRLQRRMRRDLKERGRTKRSIVQQWKRTVEPAYNKYILPTKKYADIIIET